ncbi:Holliday junction resolvase RuvX [Candidatus Dependentiae bacterium]|nr:Holliday junction resolvase RuvX [Candidatus Dependentiae bacterium]
MKTLALDIGDSWTGIAISDSLGMFAKPYTTIATHNLLQKITEILSEQSIGTIVVGYPKTMRGTESKQTQKIVALKQKLETAISSVKWLLWDERLSSKRAQKIKKTRTKEEKIKSHAIAASFILDSYLTHLSIRKNT